MGAASNSQLREPNNVFYRIKRGLSGYVSYLAACEMNTAFSEYVLYEPILRILTARNYSARCEVACPGIRHASTGDRKRIDFEAEGCGLHLAIEVKWAKSRRLSVAKDREKLVAFREAVPGARCFLCVFGRQSYIRDLTLLSSGFKELGRPVFADFGITIYGCRIFETQPNKALQPTSRKARRAKPKRAKPARG